MEGEASGAEPEGDMTEQESPDGDLTDGDAVVSDGDIPDGDIPEYAVYSTLGFVDLIRWNALYRPSVSSTVVFSVIFFNQFRTIFVE